jgi:hypothetical protein
MRFFESCDFAYRRRQIGRSRGIARWSAGWPSEGFGAINILTRGWFRGIWKRYLLLATTRVVWITARTITRTWVRGSRSSIRTHPSIRGGRRIHSLFHRFDDGAIYQSISSTVVVVAVAATGLDLRRRKFQLCIYASPPRRVSALPMPQLHRQQSTITVLGDALAQILATTRKHDPILILPHFVGSRALNLPVCIAS